MSQPIRLLAAAALAAALGACQPVHERALEPRDTGRQFTIAIANPNLFPMNVVYSAGPIQTTLGMIPPGETRQFTIPDRGGDGVSITANDPDGGHVVTKEVDLDRNSINLVSLVPR